MEKVHVIGLGMGPGDLTPTAMAVVEKAQVLAGGPRLLEMFPTHPAEKLPLAW